MGSRRLLTPEQEQQVLADYRAGLRVKVIGAKYGITPNHVSTLVMRKGAQLRRPRRSVRQQKKVELLCARFIKQITKVLQDAQSTA